MVGILPATSSCLVPKPLLVFEACTSCEIDFFFFFFAYKLLIVCKVKHFTAEQFSAGIFICHTLCFHSLTTTLNILKTLGPTEYFFSHLICFLPKSFSLWKDWKANVPFLGSCSILINSTLHRRLSYKKK